VLPVLKGGESIVTFTDLYTYLRARFGVEEGQTMAEYGVVLAVICLIVIAAFTALQGGISGAINAVAKVLPGG
jgi:Flp pilus assembly pilin Flp